jgi:hypothetical protein
MRGLLIGSWCLPLSIAALAAACASGPAIRVTYETLGQQPDGTNVTIEGDLGLCSEFEPGNDISCVELNDPGSDNQANHDATTATVWITHLASGTDAQPNRMKPLGPMYEASDLVVWLDDGTPVGYGDRVTVTGTLRYTEKGSPYIYPVTIIEQ